MNESVFAKERADSGHRVGSPAGTGIYKKRLSDPSGLSHITIGVHACPEHQPLPAAAQAPQPGQPTKREKRISSLRLRAALKH